MLVTVQILLRVDRSVCWSQSSFYDKTLDKDNEERKTYLGSWFGTTGHLNKEGGGGKRMRQLGTLCLQPGSLENGCLYFPSPPLLHSVWDPSP